MIHNNDVPGIILPCALTLILASRLAFVPTAKISLTKLYNILFYADRSTGSQIKSNHLAHDQMGHGSNIRVLCRYWYFLEIRVKIFEAITSNGVNDSFLHPCFAQSFSKKLKIFGILKVSSKAFS